MREGSAIDMTKGRPLWLIVKFSLPLLAGSALQQLYNMVDSMVVGRFVGQTALAAVGAGFPVVFLFASLFMGVGTGAMVMVSQYYGARDHKRLHATVDTVYTSMLVGGVPLSLLGALVISPLLELISIPPEVRDEAWLYLVIVIGGMLGSLGYNCNAGILQGVGDSRTPLLFLCIACGLNIVLDLFFVLVVPLGVAGVAIATVAAQIFSWLFGVVYINKRYPDLQIRPFSMRFNRAIFKQIMRLGIPAGLQMSLFSVGSLVMNRLVNSFGTAFTAGFGAANKLDTFIFLPVQSVSTAATTFTGQNIGAGQPLRVQQGVKAAIAISIGFCVLGLLVIPLGPWMMRLFSDDAEVIAAGMAFLNRIVPFYVLLAVQFNLNSVIRGAGEPIVPTVSSLLSVAIRAGSSYLLVGAFGRDNLNFSYMIGWVAALAVTLPYYFSGRWKNKSITRAGANEERGSGKGDPSPK